MYQQCSVVILARDKKVYVRVSNCEISDETDRSVINRSFTSCGWFLMIAVNR